MDRHPMVISEIARSYRDDLLADAEGQRLARPLRRRRERTRLLRRLLRALRLSAAAVEGVGESGVPR